jgi:O-antigen ligase
MSDLLPSQGRGWVALAAVGGIAVGIATAVLGPMVGIALIVAMLTLGGAVAAPGIMLAAYLLIAFYKGALQVYSPIDITLYLALANAVQVVPLVLERRRRHVSNRGIALWLSLGVLMLLGVLYSPDQALAFGKTTTYWALVVLPIVPAALRVGTDQRHLEHFLWTFLAMGLFTVAVGLASLSGTDRLVVLGMNTIQVSRAALLVPLLGVVFVLPQRRAVLSVAVLTAIPAAFVVAIASGSRGPLLMLAVTGAIGAVRSVARSHAPNWRIVGGGAALGAASIVIVAMVAPSLPALSLGRFASLGESVQSSLASDTGVSSVGDLSFDARVALFGYAVTLFEEQPLIGTGTGGYQALSPAVLGVVADAYPHNALLQVAAEFGILGLVPFVALLLIGLRRPLDRKSTRLNSSHH